MRLIITNEGEQIRKSFQMEKEAKTLHRELLLEDSLASINEFESGTICSPRNIPSKKQSGMNIVGDI